MFNTGNNIVTAYVGDTQVVKAYKGDSPSIWPTKDCIEVLFYKYGENPYLTFEFDHYGTNASTTKPNFYYRFGAYNTSKGFPCFDSEDWIEVTGNSITVTATYDESSQYCHIIQICGKGNTTIGRSQNDYTTINIIQNDLKVVSCLIYLDALLDYDNPPTVLPDYCFYKLLNWDSCDFYPDYGWMIVTYANTSGNYSFANFMRTVQSDFIIMDLSNMTNRQETTFNDWITNVYVSEGRIHCPASLYLEPNSDSGVPNGWYRDS